MHSTVFRERFLRSIALTHISLFAIYHLRRHEFQSTLLVEQEDNIYLSKGVLANSNAELVEKVVRLAKELGRDIATPDDARRILKIAKK